jgi:hypothetical protein
MIFFEPGSLEPLDVKLIVRKCEVTCDKEFTNITRGRTPSRRVHMDKRDLLKYNRLNMGLK